MEVPNIENLDFYHYGDYTNEEEHPYDMTVYDDHVLDTLPIRSINMSLINRHNANEVLFKISKFSPPIHIYEPVMCDDITLPFRKIYSGYKYIFKVNSDLNSFFENIITKYHNTQSDKNFNIMPRGYTRNKESFVCISSSSHTNLSFYGNSIFANQYSANKLYALLTSIWAQYLQYDMCFDIHFENDHTSENKSDYTPYMHIYKIVVNVNPSIVEKESIVHSRKQLQLYSNLIFSKRGLCLPVEILDKIASFLVTDNSIKITQKIKTNVLKYIETNDHIIDIVIEHEILLEEEQRKRCIIENEDMYYAQPPDLDEYIDEFPDLV
jgi:hypothetical protein